MTEFRKTMKESINKVAEDHEPLIISRSDDKDVVVISLKEYNSIQETLYLTSSPLNRQRLLQAIADVEEGKNLVNNNLIE